ncbi:MFS transporter [Microbulbifer elongatus]|uniref:MFS transporter n=1 Tax=Microbulbifer elongatus TaxID=86173 RepID=A0ABT1P5V0_9GAMM|nr:MFS transporter [Microbulbifer elongatus]MCQ3830476.1 MFS transporter [Microbulbifer elongatus]
MAFEVLKDRNYALYLGGNTVSWIGTWMQRTAIGWLSWELTESSTWVGLIVLAQYLPLVFIAPLFGVLIDRMDRRRYAIACLLVQILFNTGLFVTHALGFLNIHALLACCVLLGIGNAAYQPIRLTLIHDIAPREFLTQAISLNAVVFNVTRLVGPALGGVSISTIGVGGTFLINTLTFLGTLLALLVVQIRPTARSQKGGGVLFQLREGLRYIKSTPKFLELFILSVAIAVLGRGVLELLPAFAGGVFHSGSSGLAILMAVAGAGGIVAGVVLSGTTRRSTLVTFITIGCALQGLFVLMLGFSSQFLLAALSIFGIAAMSTLASIGMQAALQADLDGAFRGRVVSLWGMTTVAGPAVGASLLGALAQMTGLPAVAVLSGVLCAVVCCGVIWRSRFFPLGSGARAVG